MNEVSWLLGKNINPHFGLSGFIEPRSEKCLSSMEDNKASEIPKANVSPRRVRRQ